jgi:hypothetical protein
MTVLQLGGGGSRRVITIHLKIAAHQQEQISRNSEHASSSALNQAKLCCRNVQDVKT